MLFYVAFFSHDAVCARLIDEHAAFVCFYFWGGLPRAIYECENDEDLTPKRMTYYQYLPGERVRYENEFPFEIPVTVRDITDDPLVLEALTHI